MRQPLIGAVVLLVISGATATAQDMSARLDSAMRGAERNGFSGVVRVEKGGATLLGSTTDVGVAGDSRVAGEHGWHGAIPDSRNAVRVGG